MLTAPLPRVCAWLLFFCATRAWADPALINAAKEFPPEDIAAIKKTGAGISGPGSPVTGDGVVGSFAVGVAVTEANRAKLASNAAVAQGLLPPIKPLWDVHMRDTDIILGGDGNYYLTGSSGDNIWYYNDGIELWRSPDLKTWSYLGLVWSIDQDGGWEKLWRNHHNHATRAIWAPEIRYLHHNYFLTFGMPPGGMSILKSTTGRPEGPYVHATDPDRPIVGGIGPITESFLIDPTLFEDDDGSVYFTYGPGKVIARMKEDMSGFAEPLRPVLLSDPVYDPATRRDADNLFGFEGATLFKANGKYYFGSTDKYHDRYSMCMAISDNVYGPYRMRHETVPCNGGSNFFRAKDGFWYSSLFGDDPNAPWREKPGIVRIDFDAEGRIVVAKTQPDFVLLAPTLAPANSDGDAKGGAASTAAQDLRTLAAVPPMGWNSYDAYGASVTEEEFLANATYQKEKLLPSGWNLCVVDYRWSDADAATHNRNGNGGPLVMDSFGRLLPAPNRFPSADGGKGFKPLADKLHAMGFQFGIHVMRGIPRQAVSQNTPIEGTTYHAADAANPGSRCGWCGDMWGIDAAKPAGQAYYDSIFRLYASWDVDFVKVDDLSAPYSTAEIEAVRRSLDRCGRPMVFSTSPGETPVGKAEHIARQANMWRVSSDFWDRWSSLNHAFDLAAAWAKVGGPGHWPDFDMIPFGHLGLRCLDGESSPGDRWTRFTRDEQTTLMSLWCLAPSPLLLGGKLTDLDDWTLNLLTNEEALAIDQDPLGQRAARIGKDAHGGEIWARDLSGGTKAIGLFNRGNNPVEIALAWSDAGLSGKYTARDVWRKIDRGVLENQFAETIPPHASVLLKLKPVPKP